jgi:hypothetical protein
MHVLPNTNHLTNGRTGVQLELPPFGSAIIVFGSGEGGTETAPPVPSRSMPVISDRPWSVVFQGGRGVPDIPVAMAELRSWTESSDPGIRYFSGTATYKATVSAPSFAREEQVLLNLGDVHEIARVRVNGHEAGTVWAQPLTLRVDPWLKPGKNTLEIEVVNLWPNRIIGDQQPGVTQRFVETNITSYHADSSLLPSGLLGPLEWIVQQ